MKSSKQLQPSLPLSAVQCSGDSNLNTATLSWLVMCYFDMCVFDCFVDTVLGPKAWSWCALYIATLNLLQFVESAKIVVSEDCPRKTSFMIYSHFPIILVISMKPAGLIAVSMRQSGMRQDHLGVSHSDAGYQASTNHYHLGYQALPIIYSSWHIAVLRGMEGRVLLENPLTGAK